MLNAKFPEPCFILRQRVILQVVVAIAEQDFGRHIGPQPRPSGLHVRQKNGQGVPAESKGANESFRAQLSQSTSGFDEFVGRYELRIVQERDVEVACAESFEGAKNAVADPSWGVVEVVERFAATFSDQDVRVARVLGSELVQGMAHDGF